VAERCRVDRDVDRTGIDELLRYHARAVVRLNADEV